MSSRRRYQFSALGCVFVLAVGGLFTYLMAILSILVLTWLFSGGAKLLELYEQFPVPVTLSVFAVLAYILRLFGKSYYYGWADQTNSEQ